MGEMENRIFVTTIADDMEAYLFVNSPQFEETYTVEDLEIALKLAGIVTGIDEAQVNRILEERLYNMELLVASGKAPVDGVDGYYTYYFNQNPARKPVIREDGTVDYAAMNLIETVAQGQVIATYTPAVMGTGGYTVKGAFLAPKHAKELPPLKGKGFERSEDNRTYTALMTGKIEMSNDRIIINSLYEISGDVDQSTGNLDFMGDVVIHGNVCSGTSVKAGGTITVDGVVESATLMAGKDVILRSGVLGDSRAYITSRGNIYAKFFEYSRVEARGNIEADVFLDCEVDCQGKITLEGKKGRIIGGHIRAVEGIEAREIGNEAEKRTDVAVGIAKDVYQKMVVLNSKLETYRGHIEKIEEGIRMFEKAERTTGQSFKEDPRRMKLMRIRIKETALEAADRAELNQLIMLEKKSMTASVKVNRAIYPGVSVEINGARIFTKEKQEAVEYSKRRERIVMQGEEIVE